VGWDKLSKLSFWLVATLAVLILLALYLATRLPELID